MDFVFALQLPLEEVATGGVQLGLVWLLSLLWELLGLGFLFVGLFFGFALLFLGWRMLERHLRLSLNFLLSLFLYYQFFTFFPSFSNMI